jgi:Ca2+-binding RTX toxin-like protein
VSPTTDTDAQARSSNGNFAWAALCPNVSAGADGIALMTISAATGQPVTTNAVPLRTIAPGMLWNLGDWSSTRWSLLTEGRNGASATLTLQTYNLNGTFDANSRSYTISYNQASDLVSATYTLGLDIRAPGSDLAIIAAERVLGGPPGQSRISMTSIDDQGPTSFNIIERVSFDITDNDPRTSFQYIGFNKLIFMYSEGGDLKARVFDTILRTFAPAFTIATGVESNERGGIINFGDGRVMFTWRDISADGVQAPLRSAIYDTRTAAISFVGTPGTDRVAGTVFNDSLNGAAGDDQFWGADGNDIILGEDGNDNLFGGAGLDDLSGGFGNDSLWGGTENDRLFGDDGDDVLLGEVGNDQLFGWNGNDLAYGWEGNDTFYGDAGNDTLFGEQDSDLIVGGAGFDVLWGGAGFDTLFGEGDNDTLLGEQGEDVLWGGDGNDLIFGWEWNDTLFGEAGNDTLFGEQDQDVLYGWLGRDVLWGGDGNDILWGEQDNDTLFGETGDDVLLGVDGDDVMYGWTGNDSLYGWAGADALFGEAGNDRLFGEDGDDVLVGGLGRDTMTGGAGADRFFNAGFEIAAGEVDVIIDYDAADRYLFQTGAQIQYFNFNAPGIGQSAGIHVQVAGGVYILDVLGATAAQLQAQTQFF